MKIFVTGGSGFIGSLLVPALRLRGNEIISFSGDIRKVQDLRTALSVGGIDAVVHLASLASVSSCEAEPQLAYDVNVEGVQMLLRALQDTQNPSVKFVYPSTAQVYAPVSGNSRKPINEDFPIHPQNLYAMTKWGGEVVLKSNLLAHSHDVTVLRLFNHAHKIQSSSFVLSRVYQEMQRHSGRGAFDLAVGNIDLERDFGSVFDLIEAFVSILNQPNRPGRSNTFNVCSGTAKNLRVLLNKMAQKLGAHPRFVVDAEWVRPNEPRWVCGSFEKLQKESGWTPHCETEEHLLDAFLKDA